MKKKILIIEDEKLIRENLYTLLSEEGFEVLLRKDGFEGVSAARNESPDLIICDILMQGKDGYEVLTELSADESTKRIPFIFLTAKVEKEDIRKGMNLGADDFLFKPFDAEDLLNSISSRLKKAETLKADLENEVKNQPGDKYSVDDKLFIQVNNKTVLVVISEILYILAEKQYTTIKISDGNSYILRKSVSAWEKILPEKKFLRIHRSSIINIDYLTKMEKWFNGGFILYLKNIEQPFIISRRYASKLRGKLFN